MARQARARPLATIHAGALVTGLYRASWVARQLSLSPRTVRRWLRLGYIEGVCQRSSYWVMIRDNKLTVINDTGAKIGELVIT